MRNSYKSRRSEIARIVAFDHLVRQKVIKVRPYLKSVDIHLLLCADYMSDQYYDIFTISELREVCCLSTATVHESKMRLLEHELLQCCHKPRKWYIPRTYAITGLGKVVVTHYNRLMIAMLEKNKILEY